MKIRNFEYFASRVARKFDTVIQRSIYNHNSVWFANGMYMNLDGEFLYISDWSNGVPTEVMSCFVYCYNTQKDFFHDLDLIVSCINTTAEETANTNGEDITENTEPEETEEPEEPVKDIMEVKQALNSRFGKEQPNKTIIAKIEDINYCPNQNTCCIVSPFVHCDYNYKSDACIKAHKNFIHDCEQVHKHLKAINNPEWHNVSLATLANIDFDMLDEKRQLYLSLYREIKELLKDLHNCKSGRSYEKRLAKMYSRSADLVYENKVTSDYIRYVTRKVSMCNVECGLWTSANEVSTGYHKSRRYNQLTIRY
jgi:hypothetical protein